MAKMCSLLSQQGRENLNHVVPVRQITNKVNKERDKPKHRDQETKHSVKLMYILLEGRRPQSLAKPDKIEFLNETKQTELANCIYYPANYRVST